MFHKFQGQSGAQVGGRIPGNSKFLGFIERKGLTADSVENQLVHIDYYGR